MDSSPNGEIPLTLQGDAICNQLMFCHVNALEWQMDEDLRGVKSVKCQHICLRM